MLNSTDRMANEKVEREAAAKSARRAEEASIVAGLRTVLQADEQLLGFARARIAGGIKGRLNIGPEAFFAPFVNIGLTERRFVIQHLHGETGKPSEILPHFFAIADLQSIHFADIETYGGTPASRLVLHLANGQSFRLRLTGENNFASSKSLAEVFRSLTSVRKSASGPTQRVCISCRHIMDRPSKFCPYCGSSQMDIEIETAAAPDSAGTVQVPTEGTSDIEKVTVVVSEAVTESHTDLLDDALAFLRSDAVESPVTASESAAETTAAVSNPSQEESSADSTPDTTEPIASPSGVTDRLEPLASASNISDATEPIARPSSVTEESEPIADATNTGDEAASVHKPATAPAFPDFSMPAHSEDAAAAAMAHPLPSTLSPTEAPVADKTNSPSGSDIPPTSTYSEAGSSATSTVPREEAPQMPDDSASAAKTLRVHFHIKHPAVQFDEVIIGRDADDVVAKLKDRVVSELKFPIKLAAMRLTPLEFAQEIVSKYNQEERQALPRPNSCREFLHLVQAIGYATVDAL